MTSNAKQRQAMQSNAVSFRFKSCFLLVMDGRTMLRDSAEKPATTPSNPSTAPSSAGKPDDDDENSLRAGAESLTLSDLRSRLECMSSLPLVLPRGIAGHARRHARRRRPFPDSGSNARTSPSPPANAGPCRHTHGTARWPPHTRQPRLSQRWGSGRDASRTNRRQPHPTNTTRSSRRGRRPSGSYTERANSHKPSARPWRNGNPRNLEETPTRLDRHSTP